MERLVVHLSRFERETSAFGGQRSIQLSYRCNLGVIALSLETRNQKNHSNNSCASSSASTSRSASSVVL